jgi:polysaccharide export outer membrane protein
MGRIYSIKTASPLLLIAGLSLACPFSPVAQAQYTGPSPVSNPGLSSGVNGGVNAPQQQQQLYPPPNTFTESSSAAMLNSMDALNNSTKLKAGDELSYRVIEEEDPEPQTLTVSPTGDIAVPLLGEFPAAGKTCKQIADQLKPLLEKNYFYKATVIVAVQALSKDAIGRVFLTGQVKLQGAIDIPPNEVLTVSRAVLLDGGLADFADRRRVRLLHRNANGTTTTTIVDLKEILDRGHSEKDPEVHDGDTINVPEKLINF